MKVRGAAGGGFTLVELMVATGILALGLTGAIASMLASTRLDRRNDAGAVAHAVANELAGAMQTWAFADPRLAYVYGHTGEAFAAPTVESFSLQPGNPPALQETLSAPPDHQESECGFCGRDLARMNAERPYLLRRYWNVSPDPANPHLKLVAIHVTYARGAGQRGVATVVTAIADREALGEVLLRGGF